MLRRATMGTMELTIAASETLLLAAARSAASSSDWKAF
jgi:hypothetical protein